MESHQTPGAESGHQEHQEAQKKYPATLEEAIQQGYPMPPSKDEESDLREKYPDAFWPTVETRARVGEVVAGGQRLQELPRIGGLGRIVRGKHKNIGKGALREILSGGRENVRFLTDPDSHFEE